MKRLVVLVGCCVFLLAVVGCGRQNEKKSGQPKLGGETREDAFPEVMVGIWQVQTGKYENRWGIKFEPDGSILKVIHSLAGPVNVSEGGVYKEGPVEGTYFFFVLGPCETAYEPETGMLKVKIFTEYYRMTLPGGELEGRAEDYIEGPVSEDGKTWKADWRNYTWLEGAEPPPIDIVNANPVKLIFSKLDLGQTVEEDKVE